MRSETRRFLETSLPSFASTPFNRYARRSPWRPHNYENKAVFIHIPRTAGGTINRAFSDVHATGHATLAEYWSHDSKQLDACFIFTFVRNPWDRLVSAFHRVLSNPSNPHTKAWGERHLSRTQSFESFVHRLNYPFFRHTVWSHSHFRPQAEYLTTPASTKIDFIGRFESLHSDFETLAKHLPQMKPIGHANKTSRDDYRSYYNYQTKKIVEDLYAEDISRFEYTY